MCYLRNFAPIQKAPLYKEPVAVSSDLEYVKFNNPYEKLNSGFEFLQNQTIFGNSKFSSNFFNDLIKLAEKNSQAIENISSKIEENDFLLDSMQEERNAISSTGDLKQPQSETEESSMEDSAGLKSQQFLTKKLFGENKEYKYKLNLDEGFPQQIFKQRNFNFNLNLTDMKGNKIRNCICDVNGQWITETKSKQPFMKGKTESQLYHGEGSYTKIYSRDVSRFYPDGKLNIVVYPKESALKYCQGSNGLEQVVNYRDIEPLIIKDLTIKAKKKQ